MTLRLINLLSFPLKTLERLINMHLRITFRHGLLSASQHAYTMGKSVEVGAFEQEKPEAHLKG